MRHDILSLFGHTDFVPFIVLTRSRTGSNLLLSFLNAHRNVYAESEIFARLDGVDPLARLKRAFGRQPRSVKAKGFKIFYYHPLDIRAPTLWSTLEKSESLRVIHLTRENILRTLLSRKIAEAQDVWTGTAYDGAGDVRSKSVRFTRQELEEGFSRTRAWEHAAVERFGDHPFLSVTYENLVRDMSAAFARVLAFLDIPYIEPTTKLQKQNPEKLRDLIANYDEMKDAFAATQWQSFFDE